MPGRSIRIFLVDGTASGVRTAELGLSTIKAIVVPRTSLSSVASRPELSKTGVYVLVGPDSEEPGQTRAYIGEGDSIIRRLSAHNKDADKEFWEEAVGFVSKDENLTKAHVRYLEAKLIGLATGSKRAIVANVAAPGEEGKLPEPDQVEMDEFIGQARLLLGSLGFDLFEPATAVADAAAGGGEAQVKSAPEFEYSGDGYSARCVVDLDAGQFVVMKGALARLAEAPALQKTYRRIREQLQKSEVIVPHGANSLEFTQDYSFSSPSAAAQVVAGFPVNGRTAWKMVGTAKSFAEWQDEQMPVDEEG